MWLSGKLNSLSHHGNQIALPWTGLERSIYTINSGQWDLRKLTSGPLGMAKHYLFFSGCSGIWMRLIEILEKEMATHSSTLGWKIPWTEEAGRLQSMGSQRVRHNWATSLYRHIHSSSNHKRVSQKTKLIGWMVKGEDRKNILSDSILTTPQFSILREIMHFSSIIL